MDDLKKLDLYDLLGVSRTAKTKEIKTAYRKKALTCHPDKNPDDPDAAKLFHQLKKILELLSDESTRSSYDKTLKAREAVKARNDALDYERKKLKLDLEEREQRAFERQSAERLERQRREQIKKQKVQEDAERERVYQEEAERKKEVLCSYKRMKIRWQANKNDPLNGGYNEENLKEIFSKYGQIEVLVISRKVKGSALLEFNSLGAVIQAQTETGYESNPLSIKTVGDLNELYNLVKVLNSKEQPKPSKVPLIPQHSTTDTSTNSSAWSSYEDLKAMTIQRMRAAQAKKESQAKSESLPANSNDVLSE